MTDLKKNDITVFVPAAAGAVGSVGNQSTAEYLLDLIMYYLMTWILIDYAKTSLV